MKNLLRISGFKCFNDSRFELNNLTVLCGSNGTGKSSLIQALLLIRLSIERSKKVANLPQYEESQHTTIPLNDGYELALGTYEDIFNKGAGESNTKIKFVLDDDIFEMPLPAENEDPTSVRVFMKSKIDSTRESFWRKNEFYYLNAERLGPRHVLARRFTDFIHCGFKGELTAQVIFDNVFLKVSDERRMRTIKSRNLPQQVDAWLNYICPGTSVVIEPLGAMSAQVRLRNISTRGPIGATNIGFGISYVLPVIVNGLIAERNALFIVENPEAHLHPKGQSNIGYFLGIVAASGVRLVVETHSEHVINGIRRAALERDVIKRKDLFDRGSPLDYVTIYFFNGFKQGAEDIIKIMMDEGGNLKPFPRDFFDQVQQDMAETYRISKTSKNG